MRVHTPGRWFAQTIYVLSDYSILEDNLPTIVCKATNGLDAQVMAAAPDMLSALEMVLAKSELTCEVHDAVTRAIIKAKGDIE